MKRLTAGLLGLGLSVAGVAGFAASASAAPSATGAVRPLAGTVIGIEYWDAGYQGATFVITGSTCTSTLADVDASIAVMPAGWNDEISSFHSFANCWTRLWSDGGFSGFSYGYISDSPYVGDAMNDNASTIQFS